MVKIAICNQKGGVGKTTTAVNLGSALQLLGKKVMLIDLDPQANMSSYLGFDDEENDNALTITDVFNAIMDGKAESIELSDVVKHNKTNELDYIPSDISLSSTEVKLINQMRRENMLAWILEDEFFKDYDYIIIDCLPSVSTLLVNALTAANGIIVPVQAQKLALKGLNDLTNTYNQVKSMINHELEVIGVLGTMVDATNMSKNTISALNIRYNEKLFKTTISKSVTAANSSESCVCLPRIKGNKLGEEYVELAKEVEARIKAPKSNGAFVWNDSTDEFVWKRGGK